VAKDSCVEAFTNGKTPRTRGVSILDGRTALISGVIVAVLLSLALIAATAVHMRQALRAALTNGVQHVNTQSPGPELQHLNLSSDRYSVSYDTLEPCSSKVNAGSKTGSRQHDATLGSNQTVPQGTAPGHEPLDEEMRRHSV
jgi:hypothetical protein